MSLFTAILALFALSQIYWARRFYRFVAKRIANRALRLTVCFAVLAAFALLYESNMGAGRYRTSPVHLTPRDALVAAPFLWWAASSFFGFLIVALLAIPKGIARLLPKRDLPSPQRREFLGRTTAVAAGAPFVAGAYGLLYGRLNLETTSPSIRLPKLPRAFEGFRICQLSDLHIGPFMPAEEIRKYAAIANQQKAEMIVLTGDFVTFDAATQEAVVDALSALRAP